MLYIPKIDDYLKILTDEEVKDLKKWKKIIWSKKLQNTFEQPACSFCVFGILMPISFFYYITIIFGFFLLVPKAFLP